MVGNYSNRGMAFESLIEYANCRYKHDGAAVIDKQHTLCIPLRNGTGRIVSAKYEEKATVDYIGRFGTIPIAFEAKHCSVDKIDLKRVEPHQSEYLREWTKEPGAIGFVLASFKFLEFFLIPWDYWQAALTAREAKTKQTVMFEPIQTAWQTTGRASIRKDELPEAWRVSTGTNAALDYLNTVRKLWRI